MKIDFEFETQYGMFRDALHLPDDHGLSEDEINAMKQQRVNNWINIVTEASNAPSTDVIDVPVSDVVETPPDPGV
jgi:hypothetical protein